MNAGTIEGLDGLSPVHPNVSKMSHSSSNLLHSCPRKFYLYKMMKNRYVRGVLESEDSEDLKFGSAVGEGVQSAMAGTNAYWDIFRSWKGGIDDEDGLAKRKTFWHALYAVDRFIPFYNEHLSQCELLFFDGKPAVELGFIIDCGGGFEYRGKLDALLINKITNRLVPFEGKTTGMKFVHPAMYQNSGQALGYKLVTDVIARALGIPFQDQFTVAYSVYKCWQQAWEYMEFQKTHSQMALWIKNILEDIATIERHSDADYWPQHGESCYSFNKPCGYLDVCGYKDKLLLGAEPKDITPKMDKESDYPFKFKLEELVETLEIR